MEILEAFMLLARVWLPKVNLKRGGRGGLVLRTSLLLCLKTYLRSLMVLINSRLRFSILNILTRACVIPFCYNSSSGLFKAISQSTVTMGFNFKINICNPNSTSLWNDPWIHDVPLAKKPTFFRMHESMESLEIRDSIINGHWNFPVIESLLDPNVDLDGHNKVQIENDLPNNWIWWSNSSFRYLAASIYAFLNDDLLHSHSWLGRDKIWKLEVPHRVRTFMWKLAHNKIPTCDVFHNLNFGPLTYCHFCHLVPKTSTHIFWDCPRIIDC